MMNSAKTPILSGMYCHLWHVEQQLMLPPRLRWCRSFGSKLRGLTFRRQLDQNEGVVLVEEGEGRVLTAVHMLFVFCNLAIIWVNSQGEVVDTTLGRPWRLAYVPRRPAQYVIELHPDWLNQIQMGDHIVFRE